MPKPSRVHGLAAAIVGWVLLHHGAVGNGALLADDHVHLAAALHWHSPGDLFAALPPRPLQHALFWWGLQFGDCAPAAMRGVGIALHLAAILLVGLLARQWGMTASRATAAAALFAAFPATPTALWPAAVSTPGRLVAMLLACWSFGHGRRAAFGMLAVVATAIGLLFHQSAVLLPALLWLQQWARSGADVAAIRPALRAVCLRPAFWAIVLLCLLAALWFRSVPDPHNATRPWQSVLANATWASACLWPEPLRAFAIDGVRGDAGLALRVVGAACLCGSAVFFAFAWLRGRGLVRYALAAGSLDLLLPVATAGWSLRYAVPTAAFAALAFVRVASGRAAWLVTALGCCWCMDSLSLVATQRAASALSARLVDEAAAVRRQLPPEQVLYVVDAPGVMNGRLDVPLCNWGFEQAVAMRGARGDLVLLHTVQQRTSSSGRRAASAEVSTRKQVDAVLEFDPTVGGFAYWRDGQRQRLP